MNKYEEDFVELERELTCALQHVDPPQGFAERVLARTKQENTLTPKLLFPSLVSAFLRNRLIVGAIAAGFLVGVFCAEQAYVRQQQLKAQLAERQLEEGLQITNRALEHVRQQLEDTQILFGN